MKQDITASDLAVVQMGDRTFEKRYQGEVSAVQLEDNEISAGKLEIPTAFEVLYHNNIWICDTVASSHSTNIRLGAQNERDSGSASLGHSG